MGYLAPWFANGYVFGSHTVSKELADPEHSQLYLGWLRGNLRCLISPAISNKRQWLMDCSRGYSN
jgi:hypothetical protein